MYCRIELIWISNFKLWYLRYSCALTYLGSIWTCLLYTSAYGLLKQEGYICIDRRHGAKVQPTIDNSHEHQEKLLDELELLASEAIVKGMNKDEFINTCKALLQTIQYDASIVQ